MYDHNTLIAWLYFYLDIKNAKLVSDSSVESQASQGPNMIRNRLDVEN